MCAATFLGRRGIRPLSSVNVSAPSLRLTFSIPGLPYMEPCFANTAPREVPELPDPVNPVLPPIGDPEGGPTWDKGLVGVVYEVTKKDYGRIIATEGGGTSYKEIVVPCLAIPPRMSVPEKPGSVPRPFLARTLCMPFIPSDGEGSSADEGKRKGWWWWLSRGPQRPREDYAQPSARYLGLLRTGAAENELPDEYQAYLAKLQPFEVTSWRQRFGRAVTVVAWAPGLVAVMVLGRVLADGDGRMPGWLAAGSSLLFRGVWGSYDVFFRRVFGEGERTVEGEGVGGRGKIRLEG